MQRIYNIETGEHIDLWPIDAREILTKNKEWTDDPPQAKEPEKPKEKPVTTTAFEPIEKKPKRKGKSK